jgi:cytoskeletal protein RodZ
MLIHCFHDWGIVLIVQVTRKQKQMKKVVRSVSVATASASTASVSSSPSDAPAAETSSSSSSSSSVDDSKSAVSEDVPCTPAPITKQRSSAPAAVPATPVTPAIAAVPVAVPPFVLSWFDKLCVIDEVIRLSAQRRLANAHNSSAVAPVSSLTESHVSDFNQDADVWTYQLDIELIAWISDVASALGKGYKKTSLAKLFNHFARLFTLFDFITVS